MVALAKKFNVDDPSLQGGAVLIPEGQYKAVIISSEMKETKNKDGAFILMNVVITEGQHKDTELQERLNVVNKNPTAEKMAYATLANISKAIGLAQTPDDTAELHNKELYIEVKTQGGSDFNKTHPVTGEIVTQKGNDQSVIKKYLPLPKVGTAAIAPADVYDKASAAPTTAAPWSVPA